MSSLIPYGHQSISQVDIEAVIEVLRSDWLTQGPVVERFEKALADYCNANHAVAVANGTVALYLACRALDVGPGDIVWTSPNTFVASANCALYCGAQVDFVDIELDTYNLSIDALESKLIEADKQNQLPKVVIPVHFAGQSCDMRRIKKLSEEYGFYIIEDACHAIGGKYLHRPIGSCEYSDIAVFSFHPVKVITTGEGGALLTNHRELAERIHLLSTHGITKDPKKMTNASEGDWYYEQVDLGMNARITDLQCALGLSQLKRVDQFVEKRHQLAHHYDRLLSELPLVTPYRKSDAYSAFHLYVVRLKLEKITQSRRDIFNELRREGIGVHVHYIPVPMQPFYKQQGFTVEAYPNAKAYYETCLTLPLYPNLTMDEQHYIAARLQNTLMVTV